MSLTEAGRGLLAVMGDALGRIESAASHIATPGGAPIKAGIALTLSMGWLTPRLPAFQAAHPSVMLELYSLMRRPELPPRDTPLWIAFGPPPPGTDATRRFGETIIPVAAREVADQITSTEDMLNNTLIEVADHRRNWTQIFGGGRFCPKARASPMSMLRQRPWRWRLRVEGLLWRGLRRRAI